MLGIIAAILLTALAAAVAVLYVIPYRNAASSMPSDGSLMLQEEENGKLTLTWPAAEKTDFYQVEVLHQEIPEDGEEIQWVPIYAFYVLDKTTCTLLELPDDELLTIRVNTMVRYQFPGSSWIRPGNAAMEAQLYMAPPEIPS